MDKFLVIFKREYLERVRNKWFVVATLAVPAILLAAMIIPALSAKRARPSSGVSHIIVLDATGTTLGERIARKLTGDSARADSLGAAARDSAAPVVRVVAPAALASADSIAVDEIQAAASARASGPVGVLILSDTTLATGRVRYAGRNASSIADMERLEAAVRDAVMTVRLGQAGVEEGLIEGINRLRVRVASERVGDGRRGGSAAAAIIVGIGLTMLLYMAIVLHGQNVLRGVMEEKTTRVAEVVLASVKPDTLLAGKVLGVGAVGLTQVIIWFGLILYGVWFLLPILGATPTPPPTAADVAAPANAGVMAQAMSSLSPALLAASLGFFVAGFVFYAACYAAVGAMVNSEQEAQQAAIPVIFLLVGPLMFLNTVMFQPNSATAIALSWLPFSSPIIMPMRMAMTPLPWYEVTLSLALAFAGAAGVVWIAARIYRVGMLMYGKRPTLRELARWIRYA